MASLDLEPVIIPASFQCCHSRDSKVCNAKGLGHNLITNNFQSLPSKVGSSEEAHQLIGQACELRVEYQEKKADSLRRLQEVLNEVKWFDDKILEVDIHIGKIYHIVVRSGFKIPPPAVSHQELTVIVEGGKLRAGLASLSTNLTLFFYYSFAFCSIRQQRKRWTFECFIGLKLCYVKFVFNFGIFL